jgi:hypothetical protein
MPNPEYVEGDTIRGNIAAGYEEVGAVFRGFFERTGIRVPPCRCTSAEHRSFG